MGWLNRWFGKVEEPDGVKGVGFSPTFVKTVGELGWAWGSYGAIYRKQPAVRACVDFLARNIAQLNPKVYERVGNTDRVEDPTHRLAVLLHRPNLDTTRYRHLYATVADMAIYDRAFWRMMPANSPRMVMRIAPEDLVVEHNEATGRTVYRHRRGRIISRDELVIFRGYSPSGDELGVSPMETLRQILIEEAAAIEHRQGVWRNGPRQSQWLSRPHDAPEWSDEARKRFRADVESVLSGGANSGRIGILEEGMLPVGDAFSPKDLLYIEGRTLTRKEVAIQYGIAPALVGVGTDTKSNVEADHRHLYQDTLGPWLRMLQDEIELQLLPVVEPFNSRNTVYVEFNLKEKLKGSFEEETKAITTSVGVPHMSINEGRARQNLGRIDEPWADVPVQPLNVMYGGQPAVTVPTEDPGTASARSRMKAAPPPAAVRRRDEAAAQHEELLRRFFARQESSVVAKRGAKATPDRERWDRELAVDLYPLALTVTGDSGRRAARQLNGVYDEARTREWLLENAQATAANINATTFDALDAAEDVEATRAVFEDARDNRAPKVALGLATGLIGFARTEAARHSADADGRRRVKEWVVTSANSRHPELDGETVGIDDSFSNGARWPGDASAGADEATGCHCMVNLREET